MLTLYRDVAVQAAKRAVRGWPAAVSVVVYGVILLITGVLLGGLSGGMSFVGGLVISLVSAACLSGYLHMLSQAVRGSRVSLADLRAGFGALFWDVISVMFALWVINFVVSYFVRGAGPQGPALAAVV